MRVLHSILRSRGFKYFPCLYRNPSLPFTFYKTFKAISWPDKVSSKSQPMYSTVGNCLSVTKVKTTKIQIKKIWFQQSKSFRTYYLELIPQWKKTTKGIPYYLERAPGFFLISAPFRGGAFSRGGLSRWGAFKNFAPKRQKILRTALEVCVFRPIFAVKMTLLTLFRRYLWRYSDYNVKKMTKHQWRGFNCDAQQHQ